MLSETPRISRRILAAWLPWWPTERLARRRPEARIEPFVTVTEARNRLVIAATNPLAARAGLSPGMALADGRAIVSGLVTRPADPTADTLALERLARWTNRLTPRVMPDGPDTIFLDIAGCERLFGGEDALMASLRSALEDFGLTVRLALADTPGAAWALARYGADDPAIVPAGADPSTLRRALAELPVAALRLSPEVAEELTFFGLDRIRTLLPLESVELIRRFGMEPVRRLEQALGLVGEPITPLPPLRPREVRRVFPEPISTATGIRAATASLLDDLCQTLSRSGEGVRRLRLVCHRVDGGRQSIAIGTSRPRRRAESLLGLFAEKLPRIEPGFGIDEIALVVPVVEVVRELQTDWEAHLRGDLQDLHGDDSRVHSCRQRARADKSATGGTRIADATALPAGDPDADMALAELLDRLGNRLGFGRIARPVPRQSWLPECATESSSPLPDSPESTRQQTEGNGNGRDPPGQPQSAVQGTPATEWPRDRQRPLRLLSPPAPVQISPDLVPCEARRHSSNAAIAVLRRGGNSRRLRMIGGPERLECEWWQGGTAHRDYYLAEDEGGHRYWIFREAVRSEGKSSPERSSNWYLHGLFG